MKGGMIDLEHVEPIDFIIDNILSPGLSMLAADPKIGKSWFSLLMCICVYMRMRVHVGTEAEYNWIQLPPFASARVERRSSRLPSEQAPPTDLSC